MNKINLFNAFICIVIVCTNLFSTGAFAEVPVPARAAICTSCHGVGGVSNNSFWPNLAGQKKDYIIKQIHDFKSDKRQDPLMSGIAKTLSDEDIEQLAEYFSELK